MSASEAQAAEPVFIGARRILTGQERARVDMLRKRCEWLRAKILEIESRGLAPGWFFLKELAAMEWAIGQLAETPENERLQETLRELGRRPKRDLGTDE